MYTSMVTCYYRVTIQCTYTPSFSPYPANYLHKLITFIHGTIKSSAVCRYLQQNKAIFSTRWA